MMAGLGQFSGGASQTGEPQSRGTAVPVKGQPQEFDALLPEDGGASEGEPASPEEQQQYDQFVRNAMKVMYPDGEAEPVSGQVLSSLKGSDDPITSLATTGVGIVDALVNSAAKAGQKIPGDIVFHAGKEVVEQLADIAEAAGIHDFKQEELDGAFYQAVDMYRQRATDAGMIDSEQLKADWAQISAANDEDRLDEVLPGISRAAKKEG